MAKLNTVAFVALFVASLFSGSATWGSIRGCYSTCTSNFTTSPAGTESSHWGMGSSCSEAHDALLNSILYTAENACISRGYDGVCTINFIIQSEGPDGCFFNGTMMQKDGFAYYSCQYTVCEPDDDPPPYQ